MPANSIFSESLQTTLLKLIKMVENSLNVQKMLWKKEKSLVANNFSFSYTVYIRRALKTCKNKGKGYLDTKIKRSGVYRYLPGSYIFTYSFFTLYHAIQTFQQPRESRLLKTLWENEENIFPISQNVFHPFPTKP